jgi:hypothetical protein
MFEKKSVEKAIPCVKYGPFIVFYLWNFHVFSCFSGLHYDFEIYFNLNGYFSFTKTTLDSVNVKILGKKKLFLGIFFQNPSPFHTNWQIFEGQATNVNLCSSYAQGPCSRHIKLYKFTCKFQSYQRCYQYFLLSTLLLTFHIPVYLFISLFICFKYKFQVHFSKLFISL